MTGVLVAQMGARRHYVVPYELYRAGRLNRLVTDLWVSDRLWAILKPLSRSGLAGGALKRLSGRRDERIPSNLVESYPNFVLTARGDQLKEQTPTDFWARRNARFCELVVKHGFGSATHAYAFNGAALEIFQAARRRGLRTVLDQSAAPWAWNRRLLQEELQRWPGWEDTPAELDRSGRLVQREEAEWELADHVICGSDFCLSTFKEESCANSPGSVVRFPYANGWRLPLEERPEAGEVGSRNFRVLFVGTLQLRKGIQYFYQTAGLLSGERVEFRAVGPSMLSETAYRKLSARVHLTGAVPRTEIRRHYDWADVLVLPTLSEGAANVVVEAMAMGLPVITTEAAGSLIQDGFDGFLVAARNCEATAQRITELAANENLRRRLSVNAVATVAASQSDDRYIDALVKILDNES